MTIRTSSVLIALVVALTSSCGSAGTVVPPTTAADASQTPIEAALAHSPRVDLETAAHTIRTDFDEVGLKDPRAMWAHRRLSTIVIGTVADLVPGPSYGYQRGDGFPETTTTLVLDVVEAFKGDLRAGSKAYVQLFGTRDRERTLQAIPLGSVIMLYGTTLVYGGPYADDFSKGKPADADFLLPGAIGLAVVNPDGGLVFPVRGDVHPTWGFEHLIPAEALTDDLRHALPVQGR